MSVSQKEALEMIDDCLRPKVALWQKARPELKAKHMDEIDRFLENRFRVQNEWRGE